MNQIVLLLLCLAAFNAFKISDSHIVDEDGLKRIYHGVNVIYKLPPYYPPVQDRFDANDSLSDEDLANLQSWGMNVIRLYVAWQGTEPVRGQYNTTYLDEVRKIVDRCAKYNISVILDAHQDVLSRFFCGEGFPDWAVSKTSFVFPFPIRANFHLDQQGYPLIEECLQNQFQIYYFSLDTAQSFQDLFDNVNQVADHFAEFWGVVADHFKDAPNVLGYEIINEPIPGSPYHNILEFILPGKGNNKNLLPLYQKVSQQIRKYDQQKLVFFEPGTTDYLGGQFADSPGGLPYRDREVYSYHIYCPLVDDQSIPTNQFVCQMYDMLMFYNKESSARQLGVGKFMTEFGAIVDKPKGAQELNFLLSLMEGGFTSWAYWEFKYFADITTQAKPGNIESFYDQDGNLYTEKVKTLARPYATAICGTPTQAAFNPYSDQIFVLDWQASNKCNGKRTQIFLSEQFYYSNKKVQFTFCNDCQLVKVAPSYYEVVLPESFREGSQVILNISQQQ